MSSLNKEISDMRERAVVSKQAKFNALVYPIGQMVKSSKETAKAQSASDCNL